MRYNWDVNSDVATHIVQLQLEDVAMILISNIIYIKRTIP